MHCTFQISRFLFAILVVSATAFAQDGGGRLTRHANQNGRFEALMPANAVSKHVPAENIVDSHYVARAQADGEDFRLKVQVISVIDTTEEQKRQLASAYSDLARKELQKNFGTAATDKAVQQHGMLGRDFVHRIGADRSPNGREILFNQRVMFDGKRLYIATHVGMADAARFSMGQKFLNSVQPLTTR